MIARRSDWRERLAQFVSERRRMPFDWSAGVDCGLSVADAVLAMTGEDIAAPLRGYRSRFGALRAIKRAGCESVAEYLDALFERTKRPRVGDIVALSLREPLTPLVICDGRGGGWGPDETSGGLVRLPISQFATAWSV